MRLALLLLAAALSANAQATFVKVDSTTGANYKGVYGSAGAVVPLVSSLPPAGATYTVASPSTWAWNSGVFGGTCWYNSSFTISITVPKPMQIALYAVDYDSQGRSETISVTGNRQTVSSFTTGKYIVYDVVGSATFTVAAAAGPNAVISAIFFDPAGVVLNWVASTSPTVTSYLIWRAPSATSAPVFLTAVSSTTLTYTDSTGAPGDVYTVTAVVAESVPSNQATAQ